MNAPPAPPRQLVSYIARDYAPCDVVVADFESGTPDGRVRELLDTCAELSDRAARGARP